MTGMSDGSDRFLAALKKTAPEEYLSALSGAPLTWAARESLRRMRAGLPDEVVNAVLDYSLRRNGLRFVPAYAEKVAMTMASRRARTAEDAIRFFRSLSRRKAPRPEDEEEVTPEQLKQLAIEAGCYP